MSAEIILKSGLQEKKDKRIKIGKIIFSKVLTLPLKKYLDYIDTVTNGLNRTAAAPRTDNNLYFAKIFLKNNTLYYKVSNKMLENTFTIDKYSNNKIICSLKWINTRNTFSLHILKNLLNYHKKYWLTGKETDIKLLTFKQFLSLYPLQYLDQSRLSRIIRNLLVVNLQNQLIDLRSLFISKKKYHAYYIREIIKNGDKPLKDKDIQYLLEEKGIYISKRTICNCRKLLNIPNYREIDVYYDKDIMFSDYLPLSRKHFHRIPSEAGVYELSISSKIEYKNHKSNVIYIGSSKNLKKRIASYFGNIMKNCRLKKFINGNDVFVHIYLNENFITFEKKLLSNFKSDYGELPKANTIGA